MARKREHPENKAFRLLSKARYYEKLRRKCEEIENSPVFQKEFKRMKKKYPLPANDKELFKYMEKTEKEARQEAREKGEKLVKIIYFKEWNEFGDKWGINWKYSTMFNKIIPKGSVVLGKGEDGIPYMKTVSPEVTEQDILNYAPLFTYIKNRTLGKAKTGQGRKKKTEIYKQMKKEYKLRKKYEKSREIMEDIARKYGFSFSRTYRIIYTKKYE